MVLSEGSNDGAEDDIEIHLAQDVDFAIKNGTDDTDVINQEGAPEQPAALDDTAVDLNITPETRARLLELSADFALDTVKSEQPDGDKKTKEVGSLFYRFLLEAVKSARRNVASVL